MPEKKKYLIVLGRTPGMEISGKDILQASIEPFVEACPDIRVITILPGEAIPAWKAYCATRNFHHPQILVPAGFTVFHSVRKALEKVPGGALVIFQDGNRPLVRRSQVYEMLRRMQDGVRALVAAEPLQEAVQRKDEVLSCEDSFLVKMPQMYLSEDIKAAYAEAYDLSFTDPSVVAASKKIPLTPVTGGRHNIKIETLEDLSVARAISGIVTGGCN